MSEETRTGYPAGEVLAGGGMGDKKTTEPTSHPITSGTVMGGGPVDPGKEDEAATKEPKRGIFRVKIDGVVKTLNGLATGAELHRLAGSIDGFPVKLKAHGKDVPNNAEPFDLKHDHEFTTK